MTALTKLDLGSVEEIGQYAFIGCSALKTLSPNLASNLRIIDDYAFSSCAIENNMHILQSSVPSFYKIGAHAFEGYKGKIITVECADKSHGLTISDDAFANSTALEAVYLNGHLKSISASAFSSCPNISLVDLNSETVWEQTYTYSGGPFANKSKLKTVRLTGYFRAPDYLFAGSSVETAEIKSDCGVKQLTFYNCQSLKTVTWDVKIPATTLTGSPFSLSPLSNLIIGEHVTHITDYLFAGCSSLNAILSQAVTPPTLDKNAFTGCNVRAINLSVPAGSENSYKQAQGWCAFYGTCGEAVENIEEETIKTDKFLRDGQLYIRANGVVYDVQGNMIK